MTALDIAAVAIGGFAGAIIRYLLSEKLNTDSSLPFGTLLVNLLGCLLIGLVFGLHLSIPLTYFLASGFAGALTTYSTWMKEILGMARLHQSGKALGYLVGSVILGALFVYMGYVGGVSFLK